MALQPSKESSGQTASQAEAGLPSSFESHVDHQMDDMIENSRYQRSHDYTYGSSWHPQSQHMRQHSQNRSHPIAIVRGGDLKEKPEDSDDDESIIDVELDAIKLKKKYGVEILIDENQALKAPYLGSLSRSEGFLMSLPPMALSDHYGNAPPETISYGSLRDSHQKGRFLDGPSSYREPRSGRIMRLDHRLRYQAVAPSQSIGDRILQAQQQKEKRKETKKNEKIGAKTSSLAAMMNEVSHKQEKPELGSEKSLGSSIPTVDATIEDDSPAMMSTSLTAFEIMKSSLNNDDRKLGTSVDRPPDSLFPVDIEFGDSQFKPLARSNSDPFPNPHGTAFPSMQFVHPMTAPTNNVDGSGTDFGDAMIYSSSHQNPDMDGAFDMEV
eukprot:scaffold6124_cov122-Cylindrotheca_fusiformis.AAC.25